VRYLLVGNYGVGNVGDEALKDYFLKSFPDTIFDVVSAHPSSSELPRLPLGIRSLLRTPWWKTIRALRRSQGMVFGGGSLFTDTESVFACFLWGFHAVSAFFFSKPIFLAFQGIGPFKTRIAERLTMWIVRRAESISVRDRRSYERVKSWNLNKEVIQSFDPVYTMIDNSVEISKELKDMQNAGSTLVVIPRRNPSTGFFTALRDHATKPYTSVHILSLQPEDHIEQTVIDTVSQVLRLRPRIIPIHNLPQLQSEVGRGSQILSQRYHGALAALALKKPYEAISQEEGDKLSEIDDPGIDRRHILSRVITGNTVLQLAMHKAALQRV
jgi:polysaccharide pyruvyl transferase WcaK-like protein